MTTTSPKPTDIKPKAPAGKAQSTQGVWMQFEVITPERARDILDNKNGKNRSLSPVLSATYASDMAGNKWLLNNQGIGFDEEGDLLDGQHRLEAIVNSHKPREMAVFYNLKIDARATIDIGRKRTVADELRMRGITNNNQIAATVRMRLSYIEKGIGLTQIYRYSNADLIQWAEVWQDDLQDAVAKSKQVTQVIKVSPTVLSTFYAIAHEKDPDMVDAFFEKLWTGEHMAKGNPIHTLREKLIQQKTQRLKWSTPQLLWMCIRAWNAARKGEELQRLILPELVTGKNMLEAL